MPISFFSIRSKLKKLSLNNYRNAHFSTFDSSQNRKRLSKFRLVHFTDDDDLLAPAWLSHLPMPRKNILFCRWQSVRYNGDFEFRNNSSSYSFTNNYVVYPSACNLFSFHQVYQHFDQSAVHNLLPSHQVYYINKPLSITHKHPASINTLRKCLEAADWNPQALRLLVRSYVQLARTKRLPDSLSWMRVWRQEVTTLFEALLD